MSYFKFHPSHRLPVPFPCFMSFLLCRTNRSCFLSSIPLNCRCHEAGVSLCVCCVPVLKSASAWPGCLKPIFARLVFRTLARPSQAGPMLLFGGFPPPPIASSKPPSAYLPLANCFLDPYTPAPPHLTPAVPVPRIPSPCPFPCHLWYHCPNPTPPAPIHPSRPNWNVSSSQMPIAPCLPGMCPQSEPSVQALQLSPVRGGACSSVCNHLPSGL